MPPKAPKPLVYNATLVQRIDLTDALALFRIQPDEMPERPWFTPGQYCVIGLNNEVTPELGSVRRSMSIASAPEDDGPVEFYIRWVGKAESANPLTHLLWHVHDGDRIYMRPVAAGVFTIKDTIGLDDPRYRILVAAGTGSAPFVCMARSEVLRNRDADLSRHVLLHGASYPTDLGYRDELTELGATNRLHYWGTVSRPREAPSWSGDQGRVEAYFEPDRLADLEQRLHLPAGGFTPHKAAVLICGLQGTIGTTIINLIDRGFVPDHRRMREALGVPPGLPASLFFEQYDTTPVIDIKTPSVIEPLRARMQAAIAAGLAAA
jgi:ferredoxin/flavodoxin---NADP+ reductase